MTIAHRGGGGLRSENTLAAFQNALKLGCEGAELDVHLTKDRQVVVHHNPRLNYHLCRKNSGEWINKEEELAISDLTYEELLQYQVGLPNPGTDYKKRFPQLLPVEGERIPLLAEVIRLVKNSSQTFELIIEVKSPVELASDKPWDTLVKATLEVLEKEDFVERSIFCSFDWGALVHAKTLRSRIRTWFTVHPLSWLSDGCPPKQDIPPSEAYLAMLRSILREGPAPWYAGFDPRRFGGDCAQAVAEAGGDGWFMYYTDCTAEKMLRLKGLGLTGATWSVNLRDPEANEKMTGTGVDAICTDYPDLLTATR
jgi:glycerophosphoryl diester phosphodiesterase